MDNILQEGWNLKPQSIRQLQENVWLLGDGGQKYALKRSLLREKNLRFICNAEKSLLHRDFYLFAPLIPTVRGDSCFDFEGDFYTLHLWITGEDCDFNDPAHLRAAAETLFEFHLRSRDPSLQQLSKGRCIHFGRGTQMTRRCEELKTFYHLSRYWSETPFTRLYQAYYPDFFKKACQAKNTLLSSAYPRLAREAEAVGSFIHYDVAARNFIICNGKAFLIDFDYCCCDLPLSDIARLTKRGLKHQGNYEEKLDAILGGYQQYRLLTQDETRVLLAFLLFPQKFWRLGRRYFYEARSDDELFYANKLRNAIDELKREDIWFPQLKARLEAQK